MYPHRIRLRGPWECTPLAAHDPAASQRITLPARFDNGPVRLRRRFGYPGRIDTYEHVWLTFAEVVGRAEIMLNDRLLGTGQSGACEFEVTALLAARTLLEVVLDASATEAGLPGEIALEIRRDAFLRAVSARRRADDTIRVTGQVVGTGSPLELYALADGK